MINIEAHALAFKSIFISMSALPSIDARSSCRQQPAWGRSREFEITTRCVNRRNGMTQTTTGDLEDDDDAIENGQVDLGTRKRKVMFMPSLGTSKLLVAYISINTHVL